MAIGRKGLFGVLLTLTLVLGLVPGIMAAAWADDGLVAEAAVVASVDDQEYGNFDAAVDAWLDGGSTLTLLADVNTASTISVESGTKTFDLNGKELRNTDTASTGNGSVFYVTGGELTVNGSGTIKKAAGAPCGSVFCVTGGSLTVNGPATIIGRTWSSGR